MTTHVACVYMCVCTDLIHLLSRDYKGDDYPFFCIVSYWLEECLAQGAHKETLVTETDRFLDWSHLRSPWTFSMEVVFEKLHTI